MDNLRLQIDMEDMKRRVAIMAEKAAEREAAAVIQLPLWRDERRGTPNSFIRSALFAAIQSKDRVYINDNVLYSQDGITVKFLVLRLFVQHIKGKTRL